MSDVPDHRNACPDTLQATPLTPASPTVAHPVFFSVSPLKLTVMTVLTLGMYQIYWSYRHFHYIKHRDGSRIQPALRSLLLMFFCFTLFCRVDRDARSRGDSGFAATPLAVLYFLFSVMSFLEWPLWLVGILAIFPPLPLQECANRINERAGVAPDANSRFTAWNVVAMIPGTLCLLALVLLPDAPR